MRGHLHGGAMCDAALLPAYLTRRIAMCGDGVRFSVGRRLYVGWGADRPHRMKRVPQVAMQAPELGVESRKGAATGAGLRSPGTKVALSLSQTDMAETLAGHWTHWLCATRLDVASDERYLVRASKAAIDD